MAHEGFNWKQQSLLACILFSSRVQRTPIISFLLYCLFSSPPAALPASSPSLQNRQQNYPFPLSAPLASTVLPRPTLLPGAAFPSSFPAFRLPYVPQTTSVPEFESFAEIPIRPSFSSSSSSSSYRLLAAPSSQDIPRNSCVLQRRRREERSSEDEGPARVRRDEKSSSGLLRSFRKPSLTSLPSRELEI